MDALAKLWQCWARVCELFLKWGGNVWRWAAGYFGPDLHAIPDRVNWRELFKVVHVALASGATVEAGQFVLANARTVFLDEATANRITAVAALVAGVAEYQRRKRQGLPTPRVRL